MNYLWCKQCERVHTEEAWTRNGKFKYGTCPKCAAWQYRFAVNWLQIGAVNGYNEEPLSGGYYPAYKLDFESI